MYIYQVNRNTRHVFQVYGGFHWQKNLFMQLENSLEVTQKLNTYISMFSCNLKLSYML